MTTVLEEIENPKQQQLVQEEEYLTIDQIIPIWSHYLDLLTAEEIDLTAIADWERLYRLDIGSYRRCMAGEAHLFSDYYESKYSGNYCYICDRYATQSFPNLLQIIDTGLIYKEGQRDWRNNHSVKNFVRHWNKEHKDISDRRNWRLDE